MGMLRRFQAQCDHCKRKDTESGPWATDLRERIGRLGWTVGNQLICPVCNGTDDAYSEFEGETASVDAILTLDQQKAIARKALDRYLAEIGK
jgi:hypothetical protein